MRKFTSIPCTLLMLLLFASKTEAQLVINGGSITLGDNAFITVQGDFTSNADILGTGKIIMNGTTAQNMNMNGFTIPNLEINSAGGVVLTGNSRVSNSLLFTGGKIQTGNFNFALASTATVTGAGVGKFVETTGTGQLRKEITAAGNYDLTVGSGTNYMPVQYQVTGGTIATGAYVGTQLLAGSHPNKPIRAADYLPAYWKPAYSGLTGSTINLVGTYNDGAGMVGTESLLNGIRYTGSDWSLTNSTINTTNNTVTYTGVTSGSDLYAMDKFVLVNAKAFLQGAYNSTTGVMSDALRQTPNLIPLSDPYRDAPYNSSFTHTDNSSVEIANSSVFADFGTNDNIVDWVFLELRNTSNTLIQTRSALLQRDGDIVDIDGVNPVYFKNLDQGNYIVTIRHRNHLGLAADATTNAKTLSVARPIAANIFDLRTATDAQLFGTSDAYRTASHPTLGTVNLLWAGNVSGNGFVRYQGTNGPTGPNDRLVLLQDLSGVESNTLSTYQRGDVNFNRVTRYQGSNGPGTAGLNDRLWILQQVLDNTETTVRIQSIP